MYVLVSRYKSCEFSEDNIFVFLRRVSRPEKVVGLPEVRQLVLYRVWLSLTGSLAYFSLFSAVLTPCKPMWEKE